MTHSADNGAVSDRRHVRLTVESVSDSGRTAWSMDGELFPKGQHFYIRYDEPEEAQMGRTVTTLRVKASEVRVIRHGDVRFEQTFAPGLEYTGYLETPQGRLELVTSTGQVRIEDQLEAGGRLVVAWEYRLTAMGEDAGRYAVTLTAEAAPPRS